MQAAPETPATIKPVEAAALAGVRPETIYRWIRTGLIQPSMYARVGRTYLINRRRFLAFLKESGR